MTWVYHGNAMGSTMLTKQRQGPISWRNAAPQVVLQTTKRWKPTNTSPDIYCLNPLQNTP